MITPMMSTGRNGLLRSMPRPPCFSRPAALRPASTASSSVTAYLCPPMFSRVFMASCSRPRIASQRGLSGMNRASSRKAAAGKAALQNIQRHPMSTFHDSGAGTVVPAGIGSAIRKFTICAPRIPSTMVSWLSDTSLPRMWLGATSAMYIGDRPEAMPMAMPPTNRAARNALKLLKAPVA